MLQAQSEPAKRPENLKSTDGALHVQLRHNQLEPETYDRIEYSHHPLQMFQAYYSHDQLVTTVVTTYTDETKQFIQSIVRA